jgi:outer membrane receptor for monomeric catechols
VSKHAAKRVKQNPLFMQVLGRMAELHSAGVAHEQAQAQAKHEAEMKAKAEHEEAERLKRQAAEMKYSTPIVDAPASPGAKTYKETWGGSF